MTAYPHRNKRTLTAWMLVLFLVLSAYQARTVEPLPVSNDADSPSEYEIKAIYLYNFLKFIKWPEHKCELHDGRSHRIEVLGDSPFNHVLLALQKELRENAEELEITFYGPYRNDIAFAPCSLLFINESEDDNLPLILDKVAGRPVLTVADTDKFINKGVMITLVSRNSKIRWAINRQPVNESGIQLSSRLLEIAVEVINTTY